MCTHARTHARTQTLKLKTHSNFTFKKIIVDTISLLIYLQH